ncbi:ABC transporter substrate-binding protein [Methanoplanus endosymbiosus]|uniref:ABC transporter substrate-binding protein n=1 Tax=Methanoplanus endosymbiosus TaxID=33865 RepID=A0A9E7PPK5_9EURY|nr:ABC transporter substrate binding protein [Methanoplanus endosymbiosus]UUX91282.1 hypothetical protein L6E24_07795 [Methanoplanus endosymbiosus]
MAVPDYHRKITIAALTVIPVLVMVMAFIFIFLPFYAVNGCPDVNLSPVQKEDNSSWNIAVVQGGHHQTYPVYLKNFAAGIAEYGWIEGYFTEDTVNLNSTPAVLDYITENCRSDYLNFRKEHYFSSEWNNTLRAGNLKDLKSLSDDGEIDLVIALGTWAGTDCKSLSADIPVIVMGSVNPAATGIVPDSGVYLPGNIYTVYDSDFYYDQFRLYYYIFRFETIGIAYDNSTPESRSYSHIEDLRRFSDDYGVEIIEYYTVDDHPDIEMSRRSVYDAYKYLAPVTDALIITTQNGVSPLNAEEFLKPLTENRVPSFAVDDPELVRYGVLMSFAEPDYEYLGRRYSDAFSRILNGCEISNLSAEYRRDSSIIINLKTAEEIGFEVPPGLIEASDVIYTD